MKKIKIDIAHIKDGCSKYRKEDFEKSKDSLCLEIGALYKVAEIYNGDIISTPEIEGEYDGDYYYCKIKHRQIAIRDKIIYITYWVDDLG